MANIHPTLVECHGRPRQMGRQYGEQAREAIQRTAAFYASAERLATGRRFLQALPAYLKRQTPRILEELEGIAEGSGLPLESILRINCMYTTDAEWPEACTVLALAGGTDGPALGKNNDGKAGDGYAFALRRTRPDEGLPILQVVHAGCVAGMDAMNGAGLAVGHASVGSLFPRPGERLDIRLRMYDLLGRCSTTRELLEGLSSGTALTGKGFSLVAVDRAGDTVAIEAAVPLIAWRDRGKPFVYTTNHYQLPLLKDADNRSVVGKERSTYRLGFLRWVEGTSPPTSADELAKLLKTHAPWSPCRHGGPHASVTEWSMIARPKAGTMRFARGAPCENEYSEYGF